MTTRPKRPRDPVQLAKLKGDIATGQACDPDPNVASGSAPAVLRFFDALAELLTGGGRKLVTGQRPIQLLDAS
jgi:hypothetical protein